MTTRDVPEKTALSWVRWGPLSWVRCGVALRVVGLDRSARAMWLVWAPGWGEGWWSVGGRAAGQAGRGPARRALPVTGPLGDGEEGGASGATRPQALVVRPSGRAAHQFVWVQRARFWAQLNSAVQALFAPKPSAPRGTQNTRCTLFSSPPVRAPPPPTPPPTPPGNALRRPPRRFQESVKEQSSAGLAGKGWQGSGRVSKRQTAPESSGRRAKACHQACK